MERPRALLAAAPCPPSLPCPRCQELRGSGVARSPLAAVGEREACFTHGLRLHGSGRVPVGFPYQRRAEHGHSPCCPASLPDPSCSPPR